MATPDERSADDLAGGLAAASAATFANGPRPRLVVHAGKGMDTATTADMRDANAAPPLGASPQAEAATAGATGTGTGTSSISGSVGNTAGVAHLIRIEGELRQCATRRALWQHLVNEAVALLPFAQALVLEAGEPIVRKAPNARRWTVAAVSGLAEVNRDAPMLRWYEDMVRRLWVHTDAALAPTLFTLPEFADPEDPCTREASARHLLWLPLADNGEGIGAGWLLARDTAWEPGQVKLAERLAVAYAHGASAISGRSKPPHTWKRRWPRIGLIALVLCAALAFIPVPLTILAPAEVAPQDPFVVAAPVPGVVERILVQPGARVKAGEPLVQLVDTTLRSDYEVAQQKLEVARAKTLRFQQASVDDMSAKRELAVAQTEETVAAAERDFARAMLDKAVIKAQEDGVALYGDPRDWVGRPVAVGEAIMRVANPQRVEFQIKVPVADAVNLRQDAQVKVFLDAAPLAPLDATVVRAAYKAETDAAGVASFTAIARIADDGAPAARLGLRGTARVYGEDVSLFYFLLRRPIVAVRQWTGL